MNTRGPITLVFPVWPPHLEHPITGLIHSGPSAFPYPYKWVLMDGRRFVGHGGADTQESARDRMESLAAAYGKGREQLVREAAAALDSVTVIAGPGWLGRLL